MLRFFRLLRKKLLEEGHIRKYIWYAIGEVFLVVIGILIALQINNWNNDRKDRQKELAYLIGYKQDLEQNIFELDRVINNTLDEAVQSDTLLMILTDQITLSEDESLIHAISGAAGYSIYLSHEGTLQNILGAGSLEIIIHDEIRSSLATWEGGLKYIRGWEENSKRSFDQYIDFIKEELPYFRLRTGEVFTDNDDWESELSNDSYFLNLLEERIMISGILNGLYDQKKAEIVELITLVD
jgi:hypothetical protein